MTAIRLSIIIPVLQEEKGIRATLENVAAMAPGAEVLIVDGGSTDGTLLLAEEFCALQNAASPRTSFSLSFPDPSPHVSSPHVSSVGSALLPLSPPDSGAGPGQARDPLRWRVLRSERGRGRQMNLGAREATGDTLLFLHADTHLPPNAVPLIEKALEDPQILGGNFRIRFTPASAVADLYTLLYNLRSHLRIFYGDSVLWVRRPVFERLGGYPRDRLMEDFALVLRLRKAGRLAYLPAVVDSSARRFQGARKNALALPTWIWLHILLACGAGDEALERLYPPVR